MFGVFLKSFDVLGLLGVQLQLLAQLHGASGGGAGLQEAPLELGLLSIPASVSPAG